MPDIIDLAEWRRDFKLDRYRREEANCIVLAHIIKHNLYFMCEASGVERDKIAMENIIHDLEGALEIAKHLKERG